MYLFRNSKELYVLYFACSVFGVIWTLLNMENRC